MGERHEGREPAASAAPVSDALTVGGFTLTRVKLYQSERAAALCDALLGEVPWGQYTVRVYGREHPQPRLTAWMGPGSYRYAGLVLGPRPFTPTVAGIAQDVERRVGEGFNSVLCNWYRDGQDAMGYHSDNEEELGVAPLIASVSFGATRTLRVRRKGERGSVGIPLESGDLLVMPRGMQACCEHALVRTRRAVGARVNLTFRNLSPDRFEV